MQTSKIETITGKVDQINAQKMYRTELVVDGVNIVRDRGTDKHRLRCRVYSSGQRISPTPYPRRQFCHGTAVPAGNSAP